MEIRLVGIDPGITRTGIALGKLNDERKLSVIRHSVFGAEGENWLEKCDDIASRTKTWILNNTNKHTYIQVFIEEPIQFSGKSWGAPTAAIQNRLFHAVIAAISDISMEHRPTHVGTVIPTTMKKLFANNGHADKALIIRKAERFYKFKDHWTKLNKETIADAIGILYCAYLFHKNPDPNDFKGVLSLI